MRKSIGNNTSFSKRAYEKIYSCLNWKWSSCIKTLTIPRNKVICAIECILDYDDVKQKALKSNLRSVSPKEDYAFRRSILSILEDILWIWIPTSLVLENKEHIIESIKLDSFEAFSKRIIDYILAQIKIDGSILWKNYRLLVWHKAWDFEIWSKIVMNFLANWKYKFTREWSRGEIIDIDWNHITIKFSYLSWKWSNRDIETVEMDFVDIDYWANIPHYEKETIEANLNSIIEGIRVRISSWPISENLQKQRILAYLLAERFLIKVGPNEFVLNYQNIVKFVAPELFEVYNNPSLYNQKAVITPPPAEKQPNVLTLQLTTWCDYNWCTYCDFYRDTRFTTKTLDWFKAHTDKVLQLLSSYKEKIERVFIASWNALNVDQRLLLSVIRYINENLKPRRISLYWNTNSILKKWFRNLTTLNRNWLTNVYWWAESWSDEVLKYVNKWVTWSQMLEAWKAIDWTWIALSIMIMPWLWWYKYFDSHIRWTVDFLNSTWAWFINFLSIDEPDNSRYSKLMQEELARWENRPLTEQEIVLQVREIVAWLKTRDQKIWMLWREIHRVWLNPLRFKEKFDGYWKMAILENCDEYLDLVKAKDLIWTWEILLKRMLPFFR